jgi:hypothetical protein
MTRGKFLAVVFACVLAAAPASAACSKGSIKGVYGYFHGRPGALSATIVGQFTADGGGNISSGSWTETLNGTVSTGTSTGSYTVLTNCTGTLTISDEGGTPSHFKIYVNAGNAMFQIIETDANSNQPGFAVARGTATCGLSGKKEVFTTNLVGLTSNVLTDTVGQVTLSGAGKLSGTETFTDNGTVTTLAVSGTYTETSDCLGTWQVTPKGGSALHFNTVRDNGGAELLLIQTDNGTITAGNAQH